MNCTMRLRRHSKAMALMDMPNLMKSARELGVERIDFANNMAALIHGHAHPAIVAAVTAQLERGTAYTMATQAEIEYARQLRCRAPGFERMRFMNSGTEAIMAAVKAARAFTGRSKIAKIEGTYHGAYDYVEVSQAPDPIGTA